MRRRLLNLLSSLADRSTRSALLVLESENDSLRRQLAVATTEAETLAAVVARDRSRIEAETAAYNRHRADAEGNVNEQLDKRVRQFSA